MTPMIWINDMRKRPLSTRESYSPFLMPLHESAQVGGHKSSEDDTTIHGNVLHSNANLNSRVVIVVTVLAIPLTLALLQKFSPRQSSLAAKAKSVLITPAFCGRKVRVAAWGGSGLQPTRGLLS